MARGAGVTEDELYRMMYGSISFEMLYAGSELGVFDYLAKNPGATASSVGEALGLQPYPCDILLTGLRGMKLILDTDDAGLKNAPLVEERFANGRAGNHLPFIHAVVNPGMSKFIDALKQNTNAGLDVFPGTGNTLYARLENDGDTQLSLHTHLQATSRATLNDLVRTGALESRRHLIDIGGGAANNAVSLARQYPHLRITLLDLAHVIPDAVRNIAEHGLSDRITAQACDVFTDPLPTDADTALLARMLPPWSPGANQRLISKVWEALPEGGQVLLFDTMQNEQRDGPDYAILFPAYYLTVASGNGNFYRSADYEKWMREAGFAECARYSDLAVAHVLHVGTK